MAKQKVFYDTEFIEFPNTIQLISIGMVKENGEEYYAVAEFDEKYLKYNSWVEENVVPILWQGIEGLQERKPLAVIKEEILEFLGPDYDEVQLCGYYADYDHVIFCWLFGAMVDLPEGLPMYTWDLKQYIEDNNYLGDHAVNPVPHNALWDARSELETYRMVRKTVEGK